MMATSRYCARVRGLKAASSLLGLALLFSGCELPPPEGRTAFKIEGKREYASAMLIPPHSEEQRLPIRLKFVDYNVFQTSATLAPGTYGLALRAGEGMYVRREVKIEAGTSVYRIPEEPAQPTPAARSPKLTGGLYVPDGAMPPEVVVVFAGEDVIVRRAAVVNDRFATDAPSPGIYRVEVIAPGRPPRFWTRDRVQVGDSADIGIISLRAAE